MPSHLHLLSTCFLKNSYTVRPLCRCFTSNSFLHSQSSWLSSPRKKYRKDYLRDYGVVQQKLPITMTSQYMQDRETKSSLKSLLDYRSMSLAGCGFMGIYILGACELLQEKHGYFLEKVKIGGASAGSIIAAALLCQIPVAKIKEDLLGAVEQASHFYFGPANPKFDVNEAIRNCLEALPPNAHELVNGRLSVSLTKKETFSNEIIKEWHSKEELIQCIVCSCFLPFYSGFEYPSFRGVKFIDGGYTCNLPKPCEPCFTISPFFGKETINPVDRYYLAYVPFAQQHIALSYNNIVRLKQALFPPSLSKLEELYRIGGEHSKEFLKTLSSE